MPTLNPDTSPHIWNWFTNLYQTGIRIFFYFILFYLFVMLDRNSQEQQNPMKTECGKATKVCVWFVFTFILRCEECFTINARPVKCECDWPKTDRCGISRFRTVSFLEWKLNINDIFYQVCHLFQNCIQMKQFKVMCLHLKACHSDQTLPICKDSKAVWQQLFHASPLCLNLPLRVWVWHLACYSVKNEGLISQVHLH